MRSPGPGPAQPAIAGRRTCHAPPHAARTHSPPLVLTPSLSRAPALAPPRAQKVAPDGTPTKSAHPARFSPDDKFSRERVTLKKRFGILPTQLPAPEL